MRDLEAQLAQLKAFQRDQALKLGDVVEEKEALEALRDELTVGWWLLPEQLYWVTACWAPTFQWSVMRHVSAEGRGSPLMAPADSHAPALPAHPPSCDAGPAQRVPGPV